MAALELGYAHKTRSPNIYERYSWGRGSMASRMIGWYGDGNGYVGNPDLKPERADTVSAALALGGGSQGWSLRDKFSLVRTSLRWRARDFRCAPGDSVAALCSGLTPRVIDELVAPLCVSALNVPIERASGEVFLRVLHDALFAERGGADLLLPRTDLGALLPDPAARWLGAG